MYEEFTVGEAKAKTTGKTDIMSRFIIRIIHIMGPSDWTKRDEVDETWIEAKNANAYEI
jgi:hypothetical protein